MSTYQFPEIRPQHDADFVTAKGEHVEATPIAVRLSQSARGETQNQIDVAFLVADGQAAIVPPEGKVDEGPAGPVGGKVALWTGSLNGGAADITFRALRTCGYDAASTVAHYKAASDAKALGIIQALTASGRVGEVEKAMTLLALTRGDLAALGMGAKRVRLAVYRDEFTPGRGEPIVRRKVQYVNPIPQVATEDDTLKLLGALGGALDYAKPGAVAAPKAPQPGRGGTSAPPKPAVASDPVDF